MVGLANAVREAMSGLMYAPVTVPLPGGPYVARVSIVPLAQLGRAADAYLQDPRFEGASGVLRCHPADAFPPEGAEFVHPVLRRKVKVTYVSVPDRTGARVGAVSWGD